MGNDFKIIIATNALDSGGLGTYLGNIAKGFKSRGWQVYFLIIEHKDIMYNKIQEEYYCYDLTLIPFSLKKFFHVAHIVNGISPTVILLNHCALIHYTLPLISTLIKPVVVLHSDDEKFFKVAAKFKKRIFRWIAPSQRLVNQMKRFVDVMQYQDIRLIPHGVDSHHFFPVEKERQQLTSSINICFVASVYAHKGADLLPDIMQLIVNESPNVHLYIVGDGPLRSSLKNQFEKQNMSDKCTFTGIVEHETVVQYLQQADIFLLPTKLEGFGLSIVEAMLCGAVPVVSRLSGITDGIIDHGETGFLVEPGNIQEYAEAVLKLIHAPLLRKHMAESARSIAVTKFSLKTMLDNYESLFLEDDHRSGIPCVGKFGWFIESLKEIATIDADRRFLFKRLYRYAINEIHSILPKFKQVFKR